MLKRIVIFSFLAVTGIHAHAQFNIMGVKIGQYQVKFNMSNISYGIHTGGVYSFTDVGGKKWEGRHYFADLQWPETKFMFGFFGRMKVLPKNYALTSSLNFFKLAGSDLLSPNTSRYKRGYMFKTNMYELHNTCEYNFFSYKFVKQNLDVYVSAGLDLFINRPKLYKAYPDEEPRPLPLEEKHHAFAIGTPIGFGAYMTHKHSRIIYGLDFSWRKTYSDYLDGFSRPWGKHKDNYAIISLQASYMFANVYLKRSRADESGLGNKGKHKDEYSNFFMRKSKFSRNNGAQQRKVNKQNFKKFGKRKGRV